jgi:hypothetical protein
MESLAQAMSDRFNVGRHTCWKLRNILGIYQFKWVLPPTHPVWGVPRSYLLNRFVCARFDDNIIYRGQVVGADADRKNFVVQWANGEVQKLYPVHILKIWDNEKNQSAY